MTQDQIEYGEGWYETLEGPKKMRSIEDNDTLVEDTIERERWHEKGVN